MGDTPALGIASSMEQSMAQVLEGITVLDFTSGMAGSIATMALSDFGAEVIKVEPPNGDPYRAFPAALLWNRGKKSVVLDLDNQEGRRQACDLARRSDVVMQTFTPDHSKRLGLDYESLAADHAGLVYCSITGFGPRGPYANYAAHEGLVAAKCGRLMSFAGQTGREGPSYGVVNVASHSAAMAAVRGVVAALMVRDQTGHGQLVETSLLQAITYYDLTQWILWQMMIRFPEDFPSDPEIIAGRMASLQYIAARTKDGQWIQLANLMERLFHAEIHAIGLEHIYEEPRFATAPLLDDEPKEELRNMILQRMQEKTMAEWMELFIAPNSNVAAEPFMTSKQGLDHCQMVFNGHVQELVDPTVGPMRQLGTMFHMDLTTAAIKGPAPLLGQHTEEVLADLSQPPDSPARQPAGDGASGRSGESRTDAATAATLEGVTVLDLSTVIAGPLAGSLAAEMGARVIHIETLQGDWMRGRYNGIAANRTFAGTEGLSLDLKTPDGQAILRKLVAKADVLLHNMRPGAPERLNIGFDQARVLNPDIIYVYAAGYGSTGPYSHRPAMHPIGGAVSGGASAQAGHGGLPPADASLTMDELVEASRRLGRAQDVNPDPNTSMVITTAMVMALYARQRLGKPQYVEVTMIGANAYANADDFFDYDGKRDRAIPDSNGYGLNALYRLYEAADGWVFLASPLESEWTALCDALGRADLKVDPRFSDPVTRQRNDVALASELATIFAAAPAAEWEKGLSASGAGCVKVEDRGMFHFFDDDDHVRENGFTTEADHPRFGSFWRHAPVLRFSKSASRAAGGILRGQHTMPILQELGYSPEEVHGLRSKGVLDWEEL